MTEASGLISEMSLSLALARRAVCLTSQIKMPSDLTSDFCLLGPIWVWVPEFRLVRVHTRPWQGREVLTPTEPAGGWLTRPSPPLGCNEMSTKLVPERKDFLTLPKGVEVTRTGLKITAPLSYAEWEALGSHLQAVHRSVLFWIGDWLMWGQGKYGERYAQAVNATGYAVQTLMNAQSASSGIEFSRRSGDLSWSHHAEVAKAEPTEQTRLLEAAVENQLSVRQLRDEVKKKNNPEITAAPEEETASRAFSKAQLNTLSASPKT